MALYEIIGVERNGSLALLGSSEYAGTALGMMKAAQRSNMPVSSIYARKDGVSITPEELKRLSQDEPDA